MDTKAITDRVVEALSNSPEAIQGFLSDPGAAIEGIVGEHVDPSQATEVVSQLKDGILNGSIELPEGLDLANLDLSGITEMLGIDGLPDIVGNLGGILGGDSPLSGIARGIGGLFGKK